MLPSGYVMWETVTAVVRKYEATRDKAAGDVLER